VETPAARKARGGFTVPVGAHGIAAVKVRMAR